jgi:hypothetical protein
MPGSLNDYQSTLHNCFDFAIAGALTYVDESTNFNLFYGILKLDKLQFSKYDSTQRFKSKLSRFTVYERIFKMAAVYDIALFLNTE